MRLSGSVVGHDALVTLGKAVGCGGALVLGSQVLIDALIQFARPFVYTTALSPAIAAAASTAIAIIRREPERRAHLRDLIARFRSGATQLGYTLMDSVTPIQPLLIGDTEAAGSARLRVTLSAAHTAAQIDGLLAALNDARQS